MSSGHLDQFSTTYVFPAPDPLSEAGDTKTPHCQKAPISSTSSRTMDPSATGITGSMPDSRLQQCSSNSSSVVKSVVIPKTKPPFGKTLSLGVGTAAFGSEAEQKAHGSSAQLRSSTSNVSKIPAEGAGGGGGVVHSGAGSSGVPAPMSNSTSSGNNNAVLGQVKLPPKSALRGHSRSASHGGVIVPSRPFDASSGQPLHSALKKGHIRAASHGQIVDDPNQSNLKAHSRAASKTDFILPPGHLERDRTATAPVTWETHWRGHSRQASRSESIYTLRQSKVTIKSKLCFWRRGVKEDPKTRTVVPNHCVPPDTPSDQHPNGHYPNNHIRTTKYTTISFLPKNLFEQFHRFANLYFISIVLLNWIPAISAFGKEIAMLPVMFVLGVTALKDLFEDRRRNLSDRRINNSTCRIYKRELGKYARVKWKEMRVGDLVHLSCDEMIPADILVLRTNDPNGLCYIETSNLDGESNLKQREVIRGFVERQATFQPNEFKSTIEVGPPTTKIYHFMGSITHPDGVKVPVTKENLLLRDCILKNTDFVEGIVVYAGRETKAMLNNGGPRHKRTGLERIMNTEVVWCVVILAVLCLVGATGNVFWLNSFDKEVIFLPDLIKKSEDGPSATFFDACLSFLTFIIILQVMIPLSLYVTIELTKLMQIYHIQNDIELYDPETQKRIECRAMNIPEDLGQIQYIFSDKTGTLTENKMLFRRCTIDGVDYNHPSFTASDLATAGQSVSPPIKTNLSLNELLLRQNVQLSADSGNVRVTLTPQAQRIHDFFMILAVCNTVVVAKYPHHDKMNASGLIVESSGQQQYSRLPPIRETTDSAAHPLPTYPPPDQCSLLIEYPPDEEELKGSITGGKNPPTQSQQSGNNSQQRRPRLLDMLPTRPLSPISSSNETTPTESPAQRPRFLQIPPLPLLSRFSKTFSLNQPAVSPTPSPSEFKPIFEAESPDELALVEAAYSYNCKLLKRTPQSVRVAMPGDGLIEYEVLHTFPFDSVRKRMSIVLKHPHTKNIILYCKGADSAILPRLKHTRVQEEMDLINQTQVQINNYAREGLRILVMAKRVLSESEYLSWLNTFEQAELDMDNRDNLLFESYNQMESSLELVGATGIEDRLQDGVPESIESLRKAGIVVWVLTGDKQETAINIAFSCKLFAPTMDVIKLNARSKDSAERTISFYLEQAEKIQSFGLRDGVEPNQFNSVFQAMGDSRGRSSVLENPPLRSKERALVVDGRTLTYVLDQRTNLLSKFLKLTRHCSAVLCCRATPLQKAYIVQSVKDQLGMRTLAIGDGANDVSMIQRADIGIGISGKEGMQAVMASDFAISKFRYLERLLLVHGHWCYDRLARMILYFFYKNAAFVFVIFWYQLLNGWSGSVMIDQMYLMVYNLFFTALPPMAIGIYDQDASADLLLSTPRLYRQGRLQKVHQAHSFWINMLDALYQSIVIFFIAYGAYNGSDEGIFEFGTTIVVACMLTALVHMAIEAKSWTIIHVFSILASITGFYAFAFFYNTFCISCLGFENPFGVLQELIASPTHWLTIVLTIVLAVLPRLTIRCLETSLVPSDVTRTLLMKKSKISSNDEMFVTWSRSTSKSSVIKEGKFSCFRNLARGRRAGTDTTTTPNATVTRVSTVAT